MTPEAKENAIWEGNNAANDCGFPHPIFSLESAEITEHKQFAGPYEGETHIKLYREGKPGFFCMVRPDGEFYEWLTFKRDAYTWAKGSPPE